MSKFKSINYSRVVCEDCGELTVIEPGTEFGGLNCSCNDIVSNIDGKDIEISISVQHELDFVKTQTITVIGRFCNGDYEVCNSNDLDDTWRVPKDTFENTYEVKQDEVITDATDNEETDSLPKGGDSTYTITLGDLDGLTVDEIKAKFNMDELRVLAKVLKVRGASQMNEDKLIGKLLVKVE